MELQKRLAAQIMKCSPYRVVFDTENLPDIRDAITKEDIRRLIRKGIIIKKPLKRASRSRARKIQIQKTKGRRTGPGSRKGKSSARLNPKLDWMRRVKTQRELLKTLRGKKIIDTKLYRELYMKSKGGFFRSRRHMSLYIREALEKK